MTWMGLGDIMEMKSTSHRKTNMVGFHGHGPKKNQFRRDREWNGGCQEQGWETGSSSMGREFPFQEMSSRCWLHHSVNVPTTMLYTSKWRRW